MLINLEGLDGAGKTTQARLLAEHFRAAGFPAHVIHFPAYDTPTGRRIEAYLRRASSLSGHEVQELFAANRREMAPEILRRCDAGEVVILDRYYPSAWAYGIARGFTEEWLAALDAGLPIPDVVLVLDVPVEVVVERMAERRPDRYERDTLLLRAVRRAYLDLAARHGWHVIPDGRTPEKIHGEIVRLVMLSRAQEDQAHPGENHGDFGQ